MPIPPVSPAGPLSSSCSFRAAAFRNLLSPCTSNSLSSRIKAQTISKRKEQAAERIQLTLLVSQYLGTFKAPHPSGREEIKTSSELKPGSICSKSCQQKDAVLPRKASCFSRIAFTDHRQPKLVGWSILGFRKDSQSVCLSRVTSARAGGEGVGVRMLGTPPCAHKDSH